MSTHMAGFQLFYRFNIRVKTIFANFQLGEGNSKELPMSGLFDRFKQNYHIYYTGLGDIKDNFHYFWPEQL